MNIVLIGGRGSGKSTVSKALAEKLGMRLFVMDDLICYEENGKSIPEIVQEHSWNYFRDLEYNIALKLSYFKDIIIDCGGGVVTDLDKGVKQIFSTRKVKALSRNSIIIWLKISPLIACERIGEDPNRPSLTGNKSAQEERIPGCLCCRRGGNWKQQEVCHEFSPVVDR